MWAPVFVLTGSWIPEGHVHRTTVLRKKPRPQTKMRPSPPLSKSPDTQSVSTTLSPPPTHCSDLLPAHTGPRPCVQPGTLRLVLHDPLGAPGPGLPAS